MEISFIFIKIIPKYLLIVMHKNFRQIVFFILMNCYYQNKDEQKANILNFLSQRSQFYRHCLMRCQRRLKAAKSVDFLSIVKTFELG